MGRKFVNLHGHTGASVYDGLGKPEDHAEWMLKNAGEDSGAFAITNHGNMNDIGYQVATQKQYDKDGAPVKMIYGMEAYYINSLKDWRQLKADTDAEKAETKKAKKTVSESDLVIEDEGESKKRKFNPLNKSNHLVVLAQNQIGLENLFRVVSKSYREGFYRKPRIDFDMLKKHNEGLILSTACLGGLPSSVMWDNLETDATDEQIMALYEETLGPLMEVFGKERFFLELQFNKIPEQQIVNKQLIQFSKKTGYDLIVTADSHYCDPKLWRDRELYRLLGWQMQKKETIEQVKELQEKEIEDLDCTLFLKNGDQIFDAYKEEFAKHHDDDQLIEDAIARTYEIGHTLIQDVAPNDQIKLPKTFQVTETIKTPFDELKSLCINSLKKKGLNNNKEYVDRTIYELKVIKKIGVEEYFLAMRVILDILRKHMLTGVGRGSGAGCLVCYLLDITFLDPIPEGLLFERFLSESRAELPDVDSDVGLKDKSLEIIADHFGSENVLAICNYNRLQLRSLVKDIAKLYGVPFEESNKVTKVMELEAKEALMAAVGNDQKLYQFTFDGAKTHSPTFQNFMNKYPEVGTHIENLYQEIKSIGRHAGGVLVVPDAEGALPIMRIRGVDQSPITEGVAAHHLEHFGLVKFDILGLATLRIIRRCIEIILKEQGNKNPTIEDVWEFYNQNLHPSVMDPADKKVFDKVYCGGEFPSIFQFSEKAVQKFCKKAKPQNVGDISAITALWRPGPLKGGADYRYLGALDAKNKKKFKQEHLIIQKILGDTRGVLLYQEQFMLLAHELAGFSLEEANKLRKLLVRPETSLAEKTKRERIEIGNKFINGCMDKGLTEERARKLWEEEILGFISYGFNKSHSACYAYNSYQCAWLFTYFETSWIKASLECDPDLQGTINGVRGLGYKVTKPDINRSAADEWSVTKDKYCTPALTSLKGMGVTGASELVRNRPLGGFDSFQSVFFDGDYYRYSKFNKKCLQALIKMEGFESIPDAVGEGKIFKNYSHMNETLFGETTRLKKNKYITYKNIDLIRKGRNTVEELALEASEQDWSVVEKINHQREIIGFYDKGLIVGEYIPLFTEFEMDAIDDTDDEVYKQRVWAVVEDVVQKQSKAGKPYLVMKVSGMSEKMYNFRVWNTAKDDTIYWRVGNVLVFSLSYDSEWGYSVPRNSKIIKVNK